MLIKSFLLLTICLTAVLASESIARLLLTKNLITDEHRMPNPNIPWQPIPPLEIKLTNGRHF